MAYGRLEVFWPDGQFKTYALTEPSISVGRSSGNTIALDNSTLSRYHINIRNHDGEVTVTDLDSANGTFVDSVKLKHDEAHVLYGGEEIQIGELRLIYYFLDETPTRPITVPEAATQRIELIEAAFKLDLIAPDHSIAPGSHTSAQLAITNTGDQKTRFRVEISGLPSSWARIDRSELKIAPEATGDVVISFKPLRRSDSLPGDYDVQITVSPVSAPETALTTSMLLRVLPYGGFGMALNAKQLRQGERFRLHLHNQGSSPLPLAITGRDANGSLSFNIASPRVVLAPGQRLVVQGSVKPRSAALFGGERQHRFDLVVRSEDAAGFTAIARGYLYEKPPMPAWAPAAFGALAIALVALIVIGLAVLLQPTPTPQIARFEVSSAQVTQGDPLQLNWDVSDAAALNVAVDETTVLTGLDPDANSALLDTRGLTGTVTISLIALNGAQQTESSQIVSIAPPLIVNYFTYEPARLVRYVVQPLTLNWNVSGAVTTHITGLEGFSTSPINTAYGSTATLSVVGIPTTPLTVVLTANNQNGASLQQQLMIEIIDPQCTAGSSGAALFAGPDPAHQIIGTVPADTTVIVDALDPSGQWLRVQMTGGALGWGQRTDLTCADTFAVENLRKELILPTPPPTRTPTPPPSATPQPSATGSTASPPATASATAPALITPVVVTPTVPIVGMEPGRHQ
jgi:hypothetical protein